MPLRHPGKYLILPPDFGGVRVRGRGGKGEKRREKGGSGRKEKKRRREIRRGRGQAVKNKDSVISQFM